MKLKICFFVFGLLFVFSSCNINNQNVEKKPKIYSKEITKKEDNAASDDLGSNFLQEATPDSQLLINTQKIDFEESIVKPDYISSILKINIIDVISSIYDSDRSVSDKLEKVNFEEFKKVNFSSTYGDEKDYLIKGSYKTTFWKDDREILLVFINENNQYVLKFRFARPISSRTTLYSLIDFDSDGKQEIISNFRAMGNSGYYISTVGIYKYMNDNFKEVFNQELEEGNGLSPYSYKNSYEFVNDINDSSKLNILFKIETVFNEEMLEIIDKNLNDIPLEKRKTFKDEVLFIFDGKKYVPTKELYDFKGYRE